MLLRIAGFMLALTFLSGTAAASAAGQLQHFTLRGFELPDISPSASTPVVFADALQQSTPWSSATPLALDEEGDVAALRPGQIAGRLVYAAGQARPAGDYTLLYEGTATFDVPGCAVVAQSAGRMLVQVAPGFTGALVLRMLSVDRGDPARDVRLILPGLESTYATHPFYPAFVQALSGFDSLRFSKWSRATTDTASQVWPMRPRVARPTQISSAGVAPEYAIALANETGADPWFVLPVGATNAYVYGVADLVHRFLDPRLHPAFEYGDRVWTKNTPADAYAQMAARNFGLAGRFSDLEWYGLRSTQVFAIVDQAFGADAGRAIHVIAVPGSQSSGDALITNTILSLTRSGRAPYVYAVEGDAGDGPVSTLEMRSDTDAMAVWRADASGTWNGASRFGRASVVPDSDLAFGVGPDVAPSEHTRPASRGPVRLVGSGVAFQGRSYGDVWGGLGQPLADVDLSREGALDWVAANGSDALEHRRSGGAQIAVDTVGDRGAPAPPGPSRLGWRDGAKQLQGTARAGTMAIGPRAGFRISAPAGAEPRILRIYVGALDVRATLTARTDTGFYTNASLESASSARDGVFTIVYRAQRPGRITVDFTAGQTFARGGGVYFRGATLAAFDAARTAPPLDEVTYHNDLLRSGWNSDEAILNASNVASPSFGLLQTLAVDGDVMAQPLYLSHYAMPDGSTHDVLVVVTEHDSVYLFDADNGALLNKVSLGLSQPWRTVGCHDIAPEYGISATPVIDRSTGTLYVVAATEPRKHVFQTWLHALDVGTLQDKVPPVKVTASKVLSNGSTLSYDARFQYTRTSLALANGWLYFGVGSHCDNDYWNSTGWMLRYDRATLRQTAAFGTLDDPAQFLLSSIWMTGFAPAVNAQGRLFAVTGNGAFDAYLGGQNYGESAIELSSALKPLDYFTPAAWSDWNIFDEDFGSGGIMLLPPQQATVPNVAVTQGKSSTIYLLDQDNLGKLTDDDEGALQAIPYTGGGEWGGPAYYSGPTGQFVYYQGDSAPLLAFSVGVNGTGIPQLALSSVGPSNAGYGGSLPVVSSDGQTPGTGVVWLVRRSRPLELEAYDATDVSHLLFQGRAGVWKNVQNNGFVTELVANGKVYVGASDTVAVFGLGSRRAGTGSSGRLASVESGTHHVSGVIVAVRSDALTLRLWDGRLKTIDIAEARAAGATGILPAGRAITAFGTVDKDGAFHAQSIAHAATSPAYWPSDQ